MPTPVPEHGQHREPGGLRVLLLGATGTIGQATARALVEAGHHTVCLVRPGAEGADARARELRERLPGAELRFGAATDPESLRRDGFRGERFDAVVSCMASRTGAPRDAWAVDHRAHCEVLAAAKEAGVHTMVLLSAICVQKPTLEFQKAKLAFEEELRNSGLVFSIVRPTAFFKSLSGQIGRVKAGKPFLVFGDGTRTACKPISDSDLGRFIAGCLTDPQRQNRVLPIGGPGPAITPREQGEELFRLIGKAPRFQNVPTALFDVIGGVLGTVGKVIPPLAEKAEFARIAKYYGTESMLVLNPETGAYDPDATPSFGEETLFDFYARAVAGEASAELGEHAMFDKRKAA